MQRNWTRKSASGRAGTLVGVIACLFTVGCPSDPVDDPCGVAGICNDGDNCTVDTCVAMAGVANCTNTRVDCGEQICDSSTGQCVDCTMDEDCDDGDACTDDLCDPMATGAGCSNTPVVCPPGEDCVDGECAAASQFAQSVGNYTVAGSCDDGDQMVSLLRGDDGTFTLTGFGDNGPISLMVDDDTATGSDVEQFGIGGHDITITLQDGSTLTLMAVQPTMGGSCSATLTADEE